MDQAQQDEIVAAVKLKNPTRKITGFAAEDGEDFFAIRTCEPGERRIYRNLKAEGKPLDAQDALLSCVLYPDKDALKKKLDEQPFLVETIEDEVLRASGILLGVVRKKY